MNEPDQKQANDCAEDIDCDTPVTIIVKRRPRPGQEQAFEEVVTGISRAAMSFPGHLGVNIFRPDRQSSYYRIVFKFDSRRHFIQWETSAERQNWLQRFNAVDMGDPQMEILSGLETWFTLNETEAIVPPPRYKMLLIVWLAVVPVTIGVNNLLRPWLLEMHIIWQIIIMSFCIVLIMTYVAMPLMSRLFHRWLHCSGETAKR